MRACLTCFTCWTRVWFVSFVRVPDAVRALSTRGKIAAGFRVFDITISEYVHTLTRNRFWGSREDIWPGKISRDGTDAPLFRTGAVRVEKLAGSGSTEESRLHLPRAAGPLDVVYETPSPSPSSAAAAHRSNGVRSSLLAFARANTCVAHIVRRTRTLLASTSHTHTPSNYYYCFPPPMCRVTDVTLL